MVAIIVEIVTIIKRHFFAGKDVPQGHDPDPVIFKLGFGVRRTTVIDETREVGLHAAIDVEFVVDVEDKIVAIDATSQGLFLGHPFSGVFDDGTAGGNAHLGVKAVAFDPGGSSFQGDASYVFVIHCSNPVSVGEKL
jgi:hypothetical protein